MHISFYGKFFRHFKEKDCTSLNAVSNCLHNSHITSRDFDEFCIRCVFFFFFLTLQKYRPKRNNYREFHERDNKRKFAA